MAIALPNVDAKYILVLTAAFPFLPLFVSAIAKSRAVRVIVGVLGLKVLLCVKTLLCGHWSRRPENGLHKTKLKISCKSSLPTVAAAAGF